MNESKTNTYAPWESPPLVKTAIARPVPMLVADEIRDNLRGNFAYEALGPVSGYESKLILFISPSYI